MAFEELTVSVTGISPLLMHNGRLANPLDPFAKALKELTSKKKKTDTDFEAIAKAEFMGGLYLDSDLEPCITGEAIEATVRNGARKSRNGKDIECGLSSDGNWKLLYDGPKTADGLWADERFRDSRMVKVPGSGGKVLRTRPKFSSWSCKFKLLFDTSVMNKADVEKYLNVAGMYVGFLDGRPRFGRFEIGRFI